MIDITLYWNNICILSRLEAVYLKQVALALKNENINLDVKIFGLGQKYHMSEYFKVDSSIPDIIVSTDLEVFENNATFQNGLPNDFINITEHFSLKSTLPEIVNWSKKLLPFLIIPIVFYHKGTVKEIFGLNAPSLQTILERAIPISFGGIENSAGKTPLKIIHDKYGFDTMEKVAKSANVPDMPIQAFAQVARGEATLAVVPTIYAMREDRKQFFMTYPTDGALAIPSYIAVKKDKAETAIRVLKTLLSLEFCNKFVHQGGLYCSLEGTDDDEFLKKNGFKFQYPSKEYLEANQDKFYKIYDKNIRQIS